MWFSASADLALDAERDFHDIGALRYDPVSALLSPDHASTEAMVRPMASWKKS